MGYNEVVLQLGKLVCRYGDVAERAESCSHTIDRASDVVHFGVKIAAALFDGLNGFFRQYEPGVAVNYFLDFVEGEVFG